MGRTAGRPDAGIAAFIPHTERREARRADGESHEETGC
nr:MAG TPA: hypothetical protein [Caudoviricetes sp.]